MKMKNFKPVLVLSAICVAVALLLGIVNLATKNKIEKDQIAAEAAALTSVLDTTQEPKKINIPQGSNASVKELYEVEGIGYVVVVEGKGYNDTVKLTVGVIDGAVNKVVVTYDNETHGKSLKSLYESFIDLEKADVDGVEKVTGATVSSSTVKNLVKQALDCADKIGIDTSKGIYYEDAKGIISDAELNGVVLEDAPAGIVEAYSAADGRKVVIAKGQGYNGEILLAVGVNTDGKIIKMSVIAESENPPNVTDEAKDEFYNLFAGVGNNDIEGITNISGATFTSNFIKTIVKNAVAYALGEEVPEETKPDIPALVKELTGMDGKELKLSSAPETLKALYKVEGGYVAYTVTSTQYVAVETEGLTWFDNNGKVIKSNLITWTVGHDVEPGDFANGFTDKANGEIGSVDLVTGATGTSEHYRDAVKAASDYVVAYHDAILVKVEEMTGISATELELKNAPETLKALYKVSGGYVAYTITSTQYVAVETEGLTWFDNNGKVIKSNLITWTVGHDVEPGDFANGFAGLENGNIGSVDLVTEATGTSEHYRDAVKAASDYVVAIIPNLVKEMTGSDAEKLELENAPETLGALYKVSGGYVAYTVTSTQYVAVETEGLTWFDNNGKVIKSNLICWTVGHGIEPGDFANGFAGLENGNIGSVDLVTGATGTAEHYRDAVKSASDHIITLADPLVKQIKDMTGLDAVKVELENAPETLGALYKVEGGYVAYTVTSTQYVAVETEGLTWFDIYGKIIKSNLITWTVGGNAPGPDDLADRFTGKENGNIGSVDLVTGATGTSEHYRDAVKSASDYVISIERIPNLIKELTGLNSERIALENAPETLKALYKVEGGYVAYTVTSTQYVAVETEVLTWFDNSGRVIKSSLLTWTVGGNAPGPGEFANGFAGLVNASIGSVDLVSGATGTSEHYRDAVKSASDYIILTFNCEINEQIIRSIAESWFGNGCKVDLTDFKGAKFVSKIYSTCGGYAVLIEIADVNGARAIEAVVGIKDGKVIGIKIINNFVDGVEGELKLAEMQEYLDSFVGKNIDEVAKAEVKGDSDTAKRIKRAVKASLRNLDKYVTEKAEERKAAIYETIDKVVGFILVGAAFIAVPTVIIVTKKSEKRRDEQ